MNRFASYAALLLLSGCAAAPVPKPERPIEGWMVVASNPQKGDGLCYAVSAPVASDGTITKRDARAYLMATLRPSGKIEISASPGYAFKPGSKAELVIDGDPYTLFYKGSVAWARDDDDDADIIESIQNADTIEVRGLSQDNRTSVDHYASQGFSDAIEHIRELCP